MSFSSESLEISGEVRIKEVSNWMERFQHEIKHGSVKTLTSILDEIPFSVNIDEECIPFEDRNITALTYAVLVRGSEKTTKEIVKLLLKRGADAFQCTKDGPGYMVMFRSFVEEYIDEDLALEFLSFIESHHMYHQLSALALQFAFKTGKIKVIEYCERKGLVRQLFSVTDSLYNFLYDPNMKQHSNIQVRIIKLLIDYGADVNQPRNGLKALHMGLETGNESIIDAILSCKPNMNAMDSRQKTPLQLYITQKNFKIIMTEKLLENGCDPNFPTEQGQTALHMLASLSDGNRSPEVAELLIKYGADVNSKDKNGNTPLHCAVFGKKLSLIKTLVKHGANITLENADGNPPPAVLNITRKTDSIANYLIQQIVLQSHAKKINTTPAIEMFLNGRHKTRRIRDQCEKEIETMKNKTVGETNVSQFEILTSDAEQISEYYKNEKMERYLSRMMAGIGMKNSVYCEEIEQRIAEGFLRWTHELIMTKILMKSKGAETISSEN